MAFSSSGGDGPMADINVTPLVDVMLVLLIIFMITAPLMQHKVRIDLPKATIDQKVDESVEPVDLAVKENGEIYWNDSPVSAVELKAQLAVTAQKTPQPELQIRADKTTQYHEIASVMADAKAAGMVKIGFVTTPQGRK